MPRAKFHIHHVNVNVDDLDAAVPFYRDVLGLPLDPTPDQGFRSQFFRIGADQGSGGSAAIEQGNRNFTGTVDDVIIG